MPAPAALAGFLGCFALLRRGQIDPDAPSFRQSNGDGLFGGSRAVLSLTDMMDFFPDELACLGCGRFALTLVLLRTLPGFCFWHDSVPFVVPLALRRRSPFGG